MCCASKGTDGVTGTPSADKAGYVRLCQSMIYLFDEEMFFTQTCCQCLLFLAAQKILLLALDGKEENQGWPPYKMVDAKKTHAVLKKVYSLKRVDPSRTGTMLPKGGSLGLHWGKKGVGFDRRKVWRKKGS